MMPKTDSNNNSNESVIEITQQHIFNKDALNKINSQFVKIDISSMSALQSKDINTLLQYIRQFRQMKVNCSILVRNEKIQSILDKLNINRLAKIAVAKNKREYDNIPSFTIYE